MGLRSLARHWTGRPSSYSGGGFFPFYRLWWASYLKRLQCVSIGPEGVNWDELTLHCGAVISQGNFFSVNGAPAPKLRNAAMLFLKSTDEDFSFHGEAGALKSSRPLDAATKNLKMIPCMEEGLFFWENLVLEPENSSCDWSIFAKQLISPDLEFQIRFE